jgi:hypothetical protein
LARRSSTPVANRLARTHSSSRPGGDLAIGLDAAAGRVPGTFASGADGRGKGS